MIVRLTRVGAGTHAIRRRASMGRPAWNTRNSNTSPGCTTGSSRLGRSDLARSNTRSTKQSRPVTCTWYAAPSPAFVSVTRSWSPSSTRYEARASTSQAASGLSRCRSHNVTDVEIAVATVAAAVVTIQKSSMAAPYSAIDELEAA